MNDLLTRVQQLVCPPLKAEQFNAVFERASKMGGFSTDSFAIADMPFLIGYLAPSIKTMLPGPQYEAAVAALRKLGAAEKSADLKLALEITGEDSLPLVRKAVADLCARGNASSFANNRIVTAASELTRNVIMYAGRGRIDAAIDKRDLTITVHDSGPGISNLETIMSGGYKSRTGMGLGLLGVKRLATSFDVQTGATGTTIKATFAI